MFYWSIKDHDVVLTDQEEADLVRELAGPDSCERASAWLHYNMDRSARRDFETRIFAHLRKLFTDDYAEFARRYYQRDARGEAAVAILSALLDGYGRITKLATPGKYRHVPLTEKLFRNDDLAREYVPIIETRPDGEVYWITLFRRRAFSWQPLCHLCFPLTAILRVVGTVQSFVLHTSTTIVRFQPTIVEVQHSSANASGA